MRALGVHRLAVFCLNPRCLHRAVLDVGGYPADLPIPYFSPRMVCTGCGIIGADARPNWLEQPNRESLTGKQWE